MSVCLPCSCSDFCELDLESSFFQLHLQKIQLKLVWQGRWIMSRSWQQMQNIYKHNQKHRFTVCLPLISRPRCIILLTNSVTFCLLTVCVTCLTVVCWRSTSWRPLSSLYVLWWMTRTTKSSVAKFFVVWPFSRYHCTSSLHRWALSSPLNRWRCQKFVIQV